MLTKKREELDYRFRDYRRADLYNLVQPMLASSHYELMASIVDKCLSVAFQSELKEVLKEREVLLEK